jgi:dTDP-4-amino-4,6-dideoxygalactose transaminase
MPPYEEYIEAIRPLWESHWLTNMAEYHQEFERQLKGYLGVPEISLTVNGHLALEMTIQAYGFPQGSEVITTPFTFISTTHAIVRNGLSPVFCDIKRDDYTIDEAKIEELVTEKTVAIVPVQVFGNVCNIEAIKRIAQKYDLKVIYDAAHAFGIRYKDTGIGNFGDASIFSFHATKVFNSIEGGAVATADAVLIEKLYNLKNFGIRSEELVVSVGANAKMNEFQAIMGLCNLNHIEENIAARKTVVEKYNELLKNVTGVRLPRFRDEIKQNYAYYPILFENGEAAQRRDAVHAKLAAENVFARKYFYPLASDQACFKNKYINDRLDVARYTAERVLLLPLYPELAERDVEQIAQVVGEHTG